MSQEPDAFIPYATPGEQQVPPCISVISITGIVLASLTLLMRVFGLAVLAVTKYLPNAGKVPGQGPVYIAFQILVSLIFMGFGVWLLIASIQSLKRRESGRAGMVRWATFYPVALIIELIISLAVILPMTSAAMNTAMKNTGSPIPPSAMILIGVIGGVLSMIVLLILPIFVLVLFRKPNVRSAFMQ